LRWSAFVQRRPWTIAVASTLVMLLIAAPAMALRLGSSDAANDPANQTTHRAYELLAQGFGEGFNGPLLVVAKVPNPSGEAAKQGVVVSSPPGGGSASVEKLRAAIAATPGVASVAPAKLNPSGEVATITVYPHSSPQAYATTQLVSRLRGSVIPPLKAHTGMAVYVGGVTAGAVDFAAVLGHKLPLFIGVVVLLSALLLMIVFRSLVIPLQAAVMNLLSISASLGVIVAIFQWGWLGSLLGVQQGPIESFIPVMLFAIVFGLSMDYEVFLISRMHERWTHTREHSRAVAEGLALTGRVVTAAAAIMVCVFLSFMLGENRVIKEFGLSLASAVLLDALVVRCLLLPAVLHIVGERTWHIPAWLDRVLPRLNIEGTVLPSDTADGRSPVLPGTAPHPRAGVATEGAEG
jgi:RND superfamily putative drug exporter